MAVGDILVLEAGRDVVDFDGSGLFLQAQTAPVWPVRWSYDRQTLHPVALVAASRTLGRIQDALEQHLDINREESILAAAPYLAALANDRQWLPRYLATAPEPDFESRNAYETSVLIPHIDLTRGFMIRVVAWPAGTIPPRSPSAGPDNLYERESGTVAHTHDFSLLTVGYLGSGYETDVFDVPPLTGDIGDRVDLRPRGRYRLRQGTVMFYPAYRVAHIQHAPETYSISLNLIVRGPNRFADQYFYEVHDQRLVSRVGGANDNRCALLAIAALYPSATFIPALDALARHPTARVRERAQEALARCRYAQHPA